MNNDVDRLVHYTTSLAECANLGQNPSVRGQAMSEATRYLRSMADQEPISEEARNIVTIALSSMQIARDPMDFIKRMADKLTETSAKQVELRDHTGEIAQFLKMTDQNMDYVINSDVDGHKGKFGIYDGKVMQIHGDARADYTGGVAGLVAIENDGAYETLEAA